MSSFTLKDLQRFETIPADLLFYLDYYRAHKPDQCSIALKHQHKNLENYWGFPFDHNLIRSIPLYINASPMEIGNHRYIAAQGPRNNTMEEFWQMVWNENVTLIVSVTNESEHWDGKEEMKFHRFWPDQESMQKGDCTIVLKEESLVQEWKDGRQERIVSRSLEVVVDGTSREVIHLHMENWIDNDVIHPESLLALSKQIDRHKTDGAILVHCAAGIGRTGTLIAFHSLIHDLYKKKSIDPVQRIKEMRQMRWGAVVAADRQYYLLIDALKCALLDLPESL